MPENAMPHAPGDRTSRHRPHALARTWCALVLLLALAARASAQCGMENKAFRPGEEVVYDLYFNWKFVWKKVGYGRLTTRLVTHNGQKVYQNHLLTSTDGIVDRFFRMRDTLSCLMTTRLEPLYYEKAAFEGKNYYVDKAYYSYDGEKVKVKMTQVKNLTDHRQGEVESEQCVYDMLNIMARARSWDTSRLKVGQRIRFPMVDGDKVVNEVLVYRGKEVVESRNGDYKYRCLVFSFYEEKEGREDKELVRFFITDDPNHLPIRLDMNLNFGSAKAFLSSVKHNRYPLSSRVK